MIKNNNNNNNKNNNHNPQLTHFVSINQVLPKKKYNVYKKIKKGNNC